MWAVYYAQGVSGVTEKGLCQRSLGETQLFRVPVTSGCMILITIGTHCVPHLREPAVKVGSHKASVCGQTENLAPDHQMGQPLLDSISKLTWF